jgi:ABC-type glycerol-3-phosphate transport system permease component
LNDLQPFRSHPLWSVADLDNATVIDGRITMSGNILISVPMLIFFVCIRRHLIAGWEAGALKG